MMKGIITAIIAISLFSTSAMAQRFAYVDTDYILGKIPEFSEAQKEIDRQASEWKLEIGEMQKDVERLYKSFQNEQFLLTEQQKEAKIKEIEDEERRLKDFQRAKFGFEGELFQKKQELIKPIQDQVYNGIQQLAQDRSYDFIFDKANSTTILFASPENDKSDDILKRMGVSTK